MLKKRLSLSVFALLFVIVFGVFSLSQISFGAYSKDPLAPYGPTINDDNLTVEEITEDLDFPTS